MHSAVCY